MDTNVACSACQKSFYDWIVAAAPILISAAVAAIGYFQYQVNRQKLRLDLYNRRFTVYEKSLAYFQSYDPTAESIDSCARNDFTRVYRESVFLFGEESEAFKALTVLKDTLGCLIACDKRLKSEQCSEARSVYSKKKESQQDPETIMLALEKALLPWLDFKRIQK